MEVAPLPVTSPVRVTVWLPVKRLFGWSKVQRLVAQIIFQSVDGEDEANVILGEKVATPPAVKVEEARTSDKVFPDHDKSVPAVI